jgi:hypothetical protein
MSESAATYVGCARAAESGRRGSRSRITSAARVQAPRTTARFCGEASWGSAGKLAGLVVICGKDPRKALNY